MKDDSKTVREVLVTYTDGTTETFQGTGSVDRVSTYTPHHGGTDLPPPGKRTDRRSITISLSL